MGLSYIEYGISKKGVVPWLMIGLNLVNFIFVEGVVLRVEMLINLDIARIVLKNLG